MAHTDTATAQSGAEDHGEHVLPGGLFVKIWACLVVLTAVTVGASVYFPGAIGVGVALVVTLRAIQLLRHSGAFSSYLPQGKNAAAYLRCCRVRFMEINVFALFVMVVLVADRLLR